MFLIVWLSSFHQKTVLSCRLAAAIFMRLPVSCRAGLLVLGCWVEGMDEAQVRIGVDWHAYLVVVFLGLGLVFVSHFRNLHATCG